jgi:hypothetical protein
VKEFLETVYKKCASSRTSAVDEVLDVIAGLASEKKFEAMNSIFLEVDLSRIDGGTMYSLVNFTSRYINVLPDYRNFYQRCREECARRGYSEERIKGLYDKLAEGGKPLYDPNEPPYVHPDIKRAEDLDKRIAEADAAGDKQLAIWLSAYKAYSTGDTDRENEFHKLRYTLGEEELRKRTIKALRDVADLLDESAGCWPGIYYAKLPDEPLMKGTIIDGIEVIISYPWPG